MEQIIFFDGDCLICQRSVQFILKYDRKKQFLFASLQSETAEQLLSQQARQADSVVLLKEDHEYLHSDAVIEISKQLSGLAKIGYLLILFPKRFRDKIYQFTAKQRYKWLPKATTCSLPEEQNKKRFLH